MELKELKKKNKGELHKILSETREKLRDLRFKDANKQLKDIRQIRGVRRTIAQVLTLLNTGDSKEADKTAGGAQAEVNSETAGDAAKS